MSSTKLRGIGKALFAVIAAFSIIFTSITPASADGLTPFQQPTPTLTAEPGTNDGEITMKVDAGPGDPADQHFVINLYDNTNSVVYTSPTLASGDVVTATGLNTFVDYTAVATVLAWDDGAAGFSYLSADSSPATSQAAFTPPPPPQNVTWQDNVLRDFVVNNSYSDSVSVNSDFPATFSITAGALPDGISLNSVTGEVSGTPTSTGPYSFEISAESIPNTVTQVFEGLIIDGIGCENYSGASFASNILLNQDGTVIGCDYQNQPSDLRPDNWDQTFGNEFGSRFSTRLGYACDDCSVGAGGVNGDPSSGGIPLGFNINFFGTTYSNVFVNSNGSIGFSNGSGIYNEPLNEVLNGSPGIAPFAVDLDNRDVSDLNEAWGPGTDRHGDFFYWGRTTYEGKAAFVVTWMNSQIYQNNTAPQDFNTFQIVIVDNGSGDADYILNYGSTQDFKTNAGYTAGSNGPWDQGPPNSCDFNICLAAGFGSTNGDTVLYASLQDSTGYLYNGSDSAEALDGASHALNQATLNSDVPGQFIYHMVNGYVPEVAVVPSQPQNFSANNNFATVEASWDAPASIGGSPIVSYDVRYRPVGSSDPYTVINSTSQSATITDLTAGNYVFQVAARNEIGIGPFSRSYLVQVAGPVLADLTSYNEVVSFANNLVESHFTPETWGALVTALGSNVSTSNSQSEVDTATRAINEALSALVVATGTVYTVNYTDYNAAVAFANGLREADFTPETWADLSSALAVDPATLTDQTMVDAQTALINTAVNNLTLAGAGSVLQMADLSTYNYFVSYYLQLNGSRYSAESWAVLVADMSVPITRYSSQADVDFRITAIVYDLMNLVYVSDLTSYNLAIDDASQYVESGFSPASWTALQDALNTPISNTDSQQVVDAATDAIYSAIAALVPYADLTDYNTAVATATALTQADYTSESWAALVAALAIPVDPATDTQIYVNIATQNINSAITALAAAIHADTTAYYAAVSQANGLSSADYTPESWQVLQDALNAPVSNTDSQQTIDAATDAITSAIASLVQCANLTNYNDAVAGANALTSTDFTSESWQTLQDTLANNVRTSGDTQADVDASTTAISDAVDALILVVTWADNSLADFTANSAYSDSVSVNSSFPTTYSIISGHLPDGIGLNSDTGEVSGTPTRGGPYNFRILASSSPNSVSQYFSGFINLDVTRGCEDYRGASFASNILLNPDGTPIGCDYENQADDLRPADWATAFNTQFGSSYSTRLGFACDDCSVGAGGVDFWGNGTDQGGIPIGFNINFFGTTYSDIYVNSNGSVSFGHGSSEFNEPLNLVLNGSAGIAPFAVDLDNRNVMDFTQTWGPGSDRHSDFFYWGRTTYEGKNAFVVTWMNSPIYAERAQQPDFNTFQIIIVDNGSGDADYILNYGSAQDLEQNAGYHQNFGCQYITCLAAGFGSNSGDTTLYASLVDNSGYLYNGANSADVLDNGSHPIVQNSLNSDIPGQFIYHMVSGYVPEVAVVPSQPLNFTSSGAPSTVDATWDAPASIGGSPIVSYDVRFRPFGSSDSYTTVTVTDQTATISDLPAGRYVFQVAARNEIGIGPFSRSYLVNVSDPVPADLNAYYDVLNFANSLTESHFTPESWSALSDALAITVTSSDSQRDIDAETMAINTALLNLVVASGTIFSLNFTDYDLAYIFANSLNESDFTAESWSHLATALSVDKSTLSDQSMIDNQTGFINSALNHLILAGAGSQFQISDLTAYNSALAVASRLDEGDYTSESWSVLANALSVTITRYNTQLEVNAQEDAIQLAIHALVPVTDLRSYALALYDASQLVESHYSPASWSALQDALNVPVSDTDTQATVDAATDAIYSAMAALVRYADLTDYETAFSSASELHESDYTPLSWAALRAALNISVDPETDSQIYVNIATQNINSAISGLVSSYVPSDLSAYNNALDLASRKTQSDYTSASWSTLQTTLSTHLRTSRDSQADVDAATSAILGAISGLVLAPPPQVFANMTAYNAARALAATKAQLAYTPASWQALQSALTANVRTSTDSQARVDASTAAIVAAINALVLATPEVRAVHLLLLSQVVSLVKKNNVPVMIGQAISPAIKFANNSAKLTKATTKAITKLAAKWKTQGGTIMVTGFVKAKANTSKVLKLAAARALAVANLLFKLGVTPNVGYFGYGSPNTKKPAASSNSVQIRWAAN